MPAEPLCAASDDVAHDPFLWSGQAQAVGVVA
jgi:hypothetical protein